MVDQVTLHDRIYGGSVESRLAFGHVLFGADGSALKGMGKVAEGLDRLQSMERELGFHMGELDLGSLCSLCASQTGGCCSRYMAGETDSLQILMNLLVGIHVSQVQKDPSACCYLGDNGCLFLFKPMFCLNYNCHRIRGRGGDSGYQQLEKLAGALLGSQYDLEMWLFRFFLSRDFLPGKDVS